MSYQKCPKCDGSGMAGFNEKCPVCEGAMIISELTGKPPQQRIKIETWESGGTTKTGITQ